MYQGHIYIPLCFYFIGCMRLPGFDALTSFTFHYASTLSSPKRTLASLRALFTFHYASTLSRSQRPINVERYRFTFHYASTLSETSSCQLFRFLIYIPLCFYFIIQLLLYLFQALCIYIPLCFYFIRPDPGSYRFRS